MWKTGISKIFGGSRGPFYKKVPWSPKAKEILTTGRIVLATWVICCLLYSLVILGIGQAVTPRTANGWLVRDDRGQVVGSEIVAQGFSRPGYFWSRPSAVGFDAAGSGGSNLAPTNSQLRARALALIEKYGGSGVIPADLVTASASGLDPHITLRAAKYQVERAARARGFSRDTVLGLLDRFAFRTGGVLKPELLVNVLYVNLELDKMSSIKGVQAVPGTGAKESMKDE